MGDDIIAGNHYLARGRGTPLYMSELDLDEDINDVIGVKEEKAAGKEGGLAASILGVATAQLHATKVCLGIRRRQ